MAINGTSSRILFLHTLNGREKLREICKTLNMCVKSGIKPASNHSRISSFDQGFSVQNINVSNIHFNFNAN